MSVTNCKQCGREPVRDYRTITVTNTASYNELTAHRYDGNEKVMSSERVLTEVEWLEALDHETAGLWSTEEIHENYARYRSQPKWFRVWDGVSFRRWRYGYFWRYECAVDYANDAVEIDQGFNNC